jgi:hypothetical protein
MVLERQLPTNLSRLQLKQTAVGVHAQLRVVAERRRQQTLVGGTFEARDCFCHWHCR